MSFLIFGHNIVALAVKIPLMHSCPAKVGAGVPVWGAAVVAAGRFGPWGQTPSSMNQTRDTKATQELGDTPSPPDSCHAHDTAQAILYTPGAPVLEFQGPITPYIIFLTPAQPPTSPPFAPRATSPPARSAPLLRWVVARGKSNLPPSHRSRPRGGVCSWLQRFLLPSEGLGPVHRRCWTGILRSLRLVCAQEPIFH